MWQFRITIFLPYFTQHVTYCFSYWAISWNLTCGDCGCNGNNWWRPLPNLVQFFLGRFGESIFGNDLFVFAVLLWVGVFAGVFVFVFCLCVDISRTCFGNVFSCHLLVVFLLVFLVLGSGLTTFSFVFLLPVFQETKIRANNRTPHFPARFFGPFFFFFCSCRVCVIACFGRASFLLAFFLEMPFWAPCVLTLFFGFSRSFEGLELARPPVWGRSLSKMDFKIRT